MTSDPFVEFKATQREGWALFVPLEAVTTICAAQLVKHAGLTSGQTVLDVGCGTGVVAVTAARAGARVHGLDLSPVLIEHAKRHANLAGTPIDFHVGDAEALPFGDSTFDVVLSQFGHMFAPRPEVAISEMLRVLKPGGVIAFSTWPPEHFVGQMFSLIARHVPPPPGVVPSTQWGEPAVIRQRLGDAVTQLFFDRAVMQFPVLSPRHYRASMETTLGPLVKLVSVLQHEPAKLAAFRSELDALVAENLVENAVQQQFLMTRAVKHA